MRTFLSVLFVHFILLLFGIIFSGKNPQKDSSQKISVQTFIVEPPAAPPKQIVQKKSLPTPSEPIVVAAPKEEKELPKVAKTEKSPPLKKEEPKSTKVKPAVVASKGTTKKSGENQKLLAMMQTSLSKIENASTPKKGINKLSKTSPSEEISYREELVALLKLCLCLPETGEVKLKVTIDRAGNFKNMEVLEAGSKKNRSYVETALPALALPPFGKAFQKEKEHTFSLTLQSQD